MGDKKEMKLVRASNHGATMFLHSCNNDSKNAEPVFKERDDKICICADRIVVK